MTTATQLLCRDRLTECQQDLTANVFSLLSNMSDSKNAGKQPGQSWKSLWTLLTLKDSKFFKKMANSVKLVYIWFFFISNILIMPKNISKTNGPSPAYVSYSPQFFCKWEPKGPAWDTELKSLKRNCIARSPSVLWGLLQPGNKHGITIESIRHASGNPLPSCSLVLH